VDRIPEHVRPIFSPEVQDIRDQISACIRQLPDLTEISYHDEDPDQNDVDEVSVMRHDLKAEAGTISDLEVGVIEQRRLNTSVQALYADINTLNETVGNLSKLVQVIVSLISMLMIDGDGICSISVSKDNYSCDRIKYKRGT
jgi:hypothetical protein